MANSKFSIGDRVHIIPLGDKHDKMQGRVIGIFISEYGVRLECRYFHNAEAKQFYFFEDECELIKSKKAV